MVQCGFENFVVVPNAQTFLHIQSQ